MGKLGYEAITSHRWLWPLVKLGGAILFMIREAVMKHDDRRTARNRRAVTKW